MDDETDIERELTETQAALKTTGQELILNRRKAVMRALGAGWSKYRIAATLGVKSPTVDSIIKSDERAKAAHQTKEKT
jgi:DNA-binding NarL/FixJ family response regulator